MRAIELQHAEKRLSAETKSGVSQPDTALARRSETLQAWIESSAQAAFSSETVRIRRTVVRETPAAFEIAL